MKKILLIFTLIFSTSLISFAQSDKPFYESEKGKLYWNKSQPVTISVGDGENQYSYKKTFLLDTEGVNYIRSKWEVDSTGKYIYPQREVLWEIYADSHAPNTKIKYDASKSYIYKGKTYYSSDLKFILTSKDALSGIKNTYYSINGSDFIEYTDSVFIGNDKTSKIRFYSIDNVGNKEDIKYINYKYDSNILDFSVDDTPPTSSIVNENSMFTDNDKLLINSNDKGAGVNSIYYSFDGENFNLYGDNIDLSQMEDGEYTLHYYALDWVNNIEATREFNFHIDSTSPEIIVEEQLIEDNLTHLRKITILAKDNYSGVKNIMVKIGEKEYKEYEKPFYIDISQEQILIKTEDLLGNQTLRTITYKIK